MSEKAKRRITLILVLVMLVGVLGGAMIQIIY